MRKFWKWKNIQNVIKNEETGESSTQEERVLILNGTIAEESWFDDEVTPAVFKEELQAGTGPITVWINSPGGDCIAAAQIYNMLMDYKFDVTVKIDGIAASAASVIAMAGTKVLMSPVSLMMIHNPATIAFGDKVEMKKVIEMLDAVKDSIMNAYEIKTGLSSNEISKLMDNETWFDAKKALELKFCDEIMSRDNVSDFIESNPFMFQKNLSESNLTNKLMDKYLIKKPAVEETAKKEDTLSIAEIDRRLNLIEKFM
ncbi:MAG: Clp protease ClpP [Lachnospiraceae bacterium]|nr:Clp protease ClpP [Lachnospiraceae bacterium]